MIYKVIVLDKAEDEGIMMIDSQGLTSKFGLKKNYHLKYKHKNFFPTRVYAEKKFCS